MLARRTVILAAALSAVAGGSAVAIGATVNGEAKKAEAEVLGDAAKQLGVQSGDLRRALADALNSQLDKAVKAGALTQAQADAIKRRRAESGTILPGRALGAPGPRGGRGHRLGAGGRGHRGASIEAAAKALGLTRAQLHEQLRAGKTIAELAKSGGKDLADVKAAMKTAIVDRLDADVKAGRLTAARRDKIVEGLDARIDSKVDGKMGPGRPGGRGRHSRGGPPPASGSGARPGSLPAPPPGGELSPA